MPLTDDEHRKRLVPLLEDATEAQIRASYATVLGAWLDLRRPGQTVRERTIELVPIVEELTRRAIAWAERRARELGRH